MNISAGLSHITYAMNGSAQINKNAYIWPEYNAGKVTRVPSIREDNGYNFNYIKRTSMNSAAEENSNSGKINTEYTPKGNMISKPANYIPGSIFEAIA